MTRTCLVLASVILTACLWAAQATPRSVALNQVGPRITGVEPGAGKVGATATANGENLSKTTVVAVYLSDADSDHKLSVVEQTAEKIVFRVPSLKPGSYNISLQIRNEIFIQPIRFTIEE